MAGSETIALIGAVTGVVGAGAKVVQAVSQAKPVLWDPLTQSDNIEEIHDALNEAIRVLCSIRKDFENEVDRSTMKVPSETYLEWIHRVMDISNQVDEIVAKYNEHSKEKRSSWFSCFLPFPDYKEEMKKMHKKVINLLQDSDQIRDKILINRASEPVLKRRAPDIRKFETLRKPLEQILNLLNNDKIKGIRVHGLVGIGKTTIMLNVNNHEQVAKIFDIVIWLTVSKEGSKENLSTEHLQRAIMQRLKLNMGNTSNTDEAAQRILRVLKSKNFLLLLDDVKEGLNLDEIGIPTINNRSKIILTTRQHHVCSPIVNRGIKVTYLSEDEAWEMFQDIVGSPELLENHKIRPLAWRVCKECNGLPLLIERVAKTFKLKHNECLWSDGLNSWRMWPEKECQGINEMYKMLRFCYDDLDDDRQQKCFLYGALYPEDSDINTEYLLECWAAEDLLGNNHGATKEQVMIGHLILSRLKNVSLLEEGKSENHVTMHKFIRQVALYISEDDPECKHLVKTNRLLREAPDVESWCEKNRISLGDNELDQLPESPNCSMLSTLFLQRNLVLEIIPESFFEHMKKLRVLDLSHTGIIVLPSSISVLTSLYILYLNDCKNLAELPSHITELVKLEALDIRGSGVNNIPPHIEKLIHLRCLRVSFTKDRNGNNKNEIFSDSVISKLSKLEELVIDVRSPEQWSAEVVESIIIKEVASLKKLKTLKFCFFDKVVDVIEVVNTTLRIRVSSAAILRSFMEKSSGRNVQNIRFFQIFIGCQNSEQPQIPGFARYQRYIKYYNGERSEFPVPKILADADAFELVNHKDIKQLSDIGIASMIRVCGCLVESCDAIETIVGTVDRAILPNLEHLYMKNLLKLESICKGPMQRGSLMKLKTLIFTNCQRLITVFPHGVIQQLSELETLQIEGCSEVEELVVESETHGNSLVLPKLKILTLLNMQKLSSIYPSDRLEWPSLEKLNIFGCPSLGKLPFNMQNATKLKIIKAEQKWWEALDLQNHEVKERLQKICSLRSANDVDL